MQEVQKLTADLRSTSEEIRATAASFRNVADAAGPDLQRAMERMRTIADNLAKATAKFDGLVEDNRRDLRAFTRDSLPELERLLRDGREAANEVRDLTRSLRENPSQLLYQPNEQGVSIPQ
jgi:ABC-type transporter Mla subunit MlaD